jgi:hypothetical protein
MQPLAVMGTRTDRAARLGPNHRRSGSRGCGWLQSNALPLPKRWPKMTQKTQEATRTPSRGGFLNRIFTIRPTTSRRSLLAPSCRGMKRANFYLLGMASEEGELVSLGVNARPGPTATSPLPERAAQAGFSLSKRGARMVEDGSCEG